tara:strand:+ start:4467 stop:5354 length:888 start_codon:yes stop_codon:yes gene_type:complete
MILKEYALEPSVIDTIENAKYWFSLFGLDKGRQISRYPKKWKKEVYRSVENSWKTKKYVEERLLKMHSNVLRKNNRVWNNQLNWVENAIVENNKKNFDAIIAKQKIEGSKNLHAAEEIDDTHPCLNATHMVPIKRDLDGVTSWVTPLLEQANRLAFIDPFFNPEKTEYIEPLKRFFHILKNRDNPNVRFEIYFVLRDDNKAGTLSYVEDKFKKRILPLLPTNSYVSFKRIGRSENHNRYILVDGLIGASYGAGYGTGSSGSAEDDEIARFPEEINDMRWKKFVTNSGDPDFYFEI